MMGVTIVDFEFFAPEGERPLPVCVVSQDLQSGNVEKIWLEGINSPSCPYPTSDDDLFVAFYASAEIGCHLSLGWPVPDRVLDLFTEHRTLTNGLGVRNGLLDACEYWKAGIGSASQKHDMREVIMRGPPYSDEEKSLILQYCESDVRLTADLYRKMETWIDIPRALFRGRYMAAVANMEFRGIPIDTDTLQRLKIHWGALQERLIAEVDRSYGVYEGRTFKIELFEKYLAERGIAWPRTETGKPSLSDDTFKDMTKTHPELQGLKDLRYILGQLRLNALAIGSDGRNRTLLSPFRAKTGRNQPSTSKFIYGPAVWLRGLIKPEAGRALAYVDYSQQEFALAAYLSGDHNMIKAYESGDPYLTFAQMAGAAPSGATKQTHGAIREQFKVCALAVQYGMREHSLASQLNKPIPYAIELIRHHKRAFKQFWQWSDRILDAFSLAGCLSTSFGWQFRFSHQEGLRANSVKNWPMQATGAEILRLACVLLEDAGINVIAPVHDAVLIEAPLESIEDAIRTTQHRMEDASRHVLGVDAVIRTDAEIVRYPDRYADKRGVDTWQRITRLLDEIELEGHAV
ncbi:MAG: DNA polymerase [Methanocalculus sp.]|uniref:DNA polymerase n=1 Tax=Methanocalculus sp. TaxID=2004547 RepID=UPI00271E83BE|nr:DNA polymerase [Methanocalculus sp.]MDO9540410.1 DNA polymerase [Methanocalculus sp.]